MITLFTIPRAFKKKINTIQTNAILSWKKILPESQIMLFGNDYGITETARELSVEHIPNIKINKFQTPLLDDVFYQTQKWAKYKILCFISADIILTSTFITAIEHIKNFHFSKFIVCGRRTDIHFSHTLNFQQNNWETKIIQQVKINGKLHGMSGLDYIIFPKFQFRQIPPFAIGRDYYDPWFIYYCRQNNIPVIDASSTVLAIHQNHFNRHKQMSQIMKEESFINLKLAGGQKNLFSLRDANFLLSSKGIHKSKGKRKIWSILSNYYFFRLIRSYLLRPLQNYAIRNIKNN